MDVYANVPDPAEYKRNEIADAERRFESAYKQFAEDTQGPFPYKNILKAFSDLKNLVPPARMKELSLKYKGFFSPEEITQKFRNPGFSVEPLKMQESPAVKELRGEEPKPKVIMAGFVGSKPAVQDSAPASALPSQEFFKKFKQFAMDARIAYPREGQPGYEEFMSNLARQEKRSSGIFDDTVGRKIVRFFRSIPGPKEGFEYTLAQKRQAAENR